jgi:hypothetical protein
MLSLEFCCFECDADILKPIAVAYATIGHGVCKEIAVGFDDEYNPTYRTSVGSAAKR